MIGARVKNCDLQTKISPLGSKIDAHCKKLCAFGQNLKATTGNNIWFEFYKICKNYYFHDAAL